MNIKDIESEGISGDRLDAIFQRQRGLMDKYKEIEGLPSPPLNLDVATDQKILKDFAWRITEEIGEAFECFDSHSMTDWDHVQEEIADALHFLIELMIFSNVDVDHFGLSKMDKLGFVFNVARNTLTSHAEREDDISAIAMYGRFATELSKTMNCLKNKPWKQTQMFTDKNKYRARLTNTLVYFFVLCTQLGIDADMITDLYFRKSKINKFRQESNY